MTRRERVLAGVGAGLLVLAAIQGAWWLGAIGLLALLFAAGAHSERRKLARLAAASSGSTRVETVPADRANSVIGEYAAAGWSMISQSTAKSFGRSARVTLTFRKGTNCP